MCSFVIIIIIIIKDFQYQNSSSILTSVTLIWIIAPQLSLVILAASFQCLAGQMWYSDQLTSSAALIFDTVCLSDDRQVKASITFVE